LSGPDALPGAAWDVMTEAGRLGAITTPFLNDQERGQVEALVSAGRGDLAWLAQGGRADRKAA
jgi:hypothetical protein